MSSAEGGTRPSRHAVDTCCDNGRVRDASIDPGTGLRRFRRYTWWAVPGTMAACLLFFVGEWVLDPDVPVWARGTSAVALAVTVTASVVLLSRRLALVPTEASGAHPGRLPAGWLIAGSAGAVVLSVVPLAVRNYGLWAIAPAAMVSITATFLPPRRRRVLIASAAVVAPVPGGIVSLFTGDGELLYAALFPLGLFAFIAWVTLGPVWAWDIAARLTQARALAAE